MLSSSSVQRRSTLGRRDSEKATRSAWRPCSLVKLSFQFWQFAHRLCAWSIAVVLDAMMIVNNVLLLESASSNTREKLDPPITSHSITLRGPHKRFDLFPRTAFQIQLTGFKRHMSGQS
ncbi:hypothetical protein KCU90_g187, partial [Aureobasidium melanogenum]